jgi:hypothetical protein
MYKLIASFLSSKYTTNPLQFLYDIKENILEDLNKHSGTIDNLNFREIFEEVSSIIN